LEDIRWFDGFGREERMKGVVGLTPTINKILTTNMNMRLPLTKY